MSCENPVIVFPPKIPIPDPYCIDPVTINLYTDDEEKKKLDIFKRLEKQRRKSWLSGFFTSIEFAETIKSYIPSFYGKKASLDIVFKCSENAPPHNYHGIDTDDSIRELYETWKMYERTNTWVVLRLPYPKWYERRLRKYKRWCKADKKWRKQKHIRCPK